MAPLLAQKTREKWGTRTRPHRPWFPAFENHEGWVTRLYSEELNLGVHLSVTNVDYLLRFDRPVLVSHVGAR